VLKAGVWYMAARTGAGAEPRTYRLSNILALTTLAQRFSAPRAFDLAAYWQESTRRFETGVYTGTASLRVSPRGWRLLRQISTAVAEAAERSVVKDRRGWFRVSVPIESVAHAANQLITLGADAEVLAPTALRAQLRLTARRLVKLYAG
jgi:predicted DNA-binding transcriptional regulator YafY